MPLTHVTITGADDSVSPTALSVLSKAYPFVEWGILRSATRAGEPRYPTASWRDAFAAIIVRHDLRASLHLCGTLAHELARGHQSIPLYERIPYQRLQLNLGSYAQPVRAAAFPDVVAEFAAGRDVIFQLGASGLAFFEAYCVDHGNGLPLFDDSGGRGATPGAWSTPFAREGATRYVPHGYAGGLSPETLPRELPRIAEAAGDTPFWIDMETGVRTGDRLDLSKVIHVLDLCEEWQRQEEQ